MSELIAVVELGSNATRCLLARVTPGVGFRVLEEERVRTRLGSGRAGVLPRSAVTATTRAVRRFLRRVPAEPPPRILVVATAAVRDAPNREGLLAGVRREAGVRVQVLSGREEARLGALAVRHGLAVGDGDVADLGGGSLQLTRLRRHRIVAARSLPLGAVRLTRRFLHHDPATPRELRALRDAIRTSLAGIPPARAGAALVGLGGTVRALARLHVEARPGAGASRHGHGLVLRQSDVTAVREGLEPLSVRQRRRIRGLTADRADIILAGAIVVEDLMVFGGYPTLTVCSRGVRDGILFREAFHRPLPGAPTRAWLRERRRHAPLGAAARA